MKKNILFTLVFAVILASLLITGCGSSGGGDSTSTLSPEELEVATAVDSFSAAVKAEDYAGAVSFVDTNLYYYRVGNIVERGPEFSNRLKTFFSNAVIKDFQISGLGIVVNSDTLAEGRGNLSLTWADNAGIEKPAITENIKMLFERAPNGPWGLIEFGVYSATSKGSAFPPEL